MFNYFDLAKQLLVSKSELKRLEGEYQKQYPGDSMMQELKLVRYFLGMKYSSQKIPAGGRGTRIWSNLVNSSANYRGFIKS